MNPTPSSNPIAEPANAPVRRPRRWVPYAGGLLLIALIVAGLWPKRIPVETVSATRGTLRAVVSEEGKTRVTQKYTIAAPVAGQLRRIPYKAGEPVIAGQTVVAVIDATAPSLLNPRERSQAEARRDNAAANLQKAQAAHAYASNELRRYTKMRDDKVSTPQDFDAAQWRNDSAVKDVAAAASALRQAEAELAEFAPGADTRPPTEIKAPVSGRVLKVLESSARDVSIGAPLVEIGDPADLEVVVDVLSRDGAAIAPGAKMSLEQWGGATPIEARVRLVEPAAFTKVSALGVEEQRVNVIADILTPVAQRPGLGDSFRVEARITVWEADNVVKVPTGALFRQGDKWAAFVVREGRAHVSTVEAGRASETEIQILGGLNEGDELILFPGDRVHEGQRINKVVI